MSSIALASNPIHHKKIKHIEVDLHFVRDRVLEKIIEIRYVSTQEHIAYILNKSLGIKRFQYLQRRLNVAVVDRIETKLSH